jgi:hypothetical protein
MPGDRRLQILALAHLALGGVTSVLAQVEISTLFEFKHIPSVPFFAAAFCQSFLLSLWGAASQVMLWKRLAGLVTGVLYLEALAPRDLRREFPGIWTITITVTMGSLLVLRRFGVIVKRPGDHGQPARPEPKGPRFSIRGVMIFTAAIALLCAGARALQASSQRLLLIILVFVWVTSIVAVGLVSLWAALGDARPLRRGPAVFVLSPALGVYLAVPAHTAGRVYILLIMVLYPTALMASLLIVRSCGYRLVRWASTEWIGLLGSARARQEGSPLAPSPSHRPVG